VESLILFFLFCSPAFGQDSNLINFSLKDCTVEDGLKIAAMKGQFGLVILCKKPQPRLSMNLESEQPEMAISKVAEAAGFGNLIEGNIRILTTPEIAAYYPRFSQQGVDPGSPTISLDFSETDIRDLMRVVAEHSKTSIALEKSLRGNLTVRVRDAPWRLVVHTIAAAIGAECRFTSSNVYIAPRGRINSLVGAESPSESASRTISLDVRDMDIRDIASMIARYFSHGFIAEATVRGNVTLKLQSVGESQALGWLARSQGFGIQLFGETWVMADSRYLGLVNKNWKGLPPLPGSKTISLAFRDTRLKDVLDVVSRHEGFELAPSRGLDGHITLNMMDRPPEEVFRLLASVHRLTYEVAGNRVIIKPEGPATQFPDEPATVSGPTTPSLTTPMMTGIEPTTSAQSAEVEPPITPDESAKKLVVQGIVGNEELRVAVAALNGKIILLRAGGTINGRFKILEILPDRVVIYFIAEQVRRTLTLSR